MFQLQSWQQLASLGISRGVYGAHPLPLLVVLTSLTSDMGRKTTLEAEWDKLQNPGMGAEATWSSAVEAACEMDFARLLVG